jgi:hypothetical protein
MKKVILVLVIAVLCIGFIVFGIFFYLNMPRKIKIFEEYQVYTKRETVGIFWKIIENDDIRYHLAKKLEIDIPKIDFNKYYLLVSDGRRIKEIHYTIGSKYKWCFNDPKGVEVFDKTLHPHTAFIYKIERVYVKQDAD